MSFIRHTNIDSMPSGLIDAFGRFRISQPYTLFDSQHRYHDNEKWDTSLSSGATISHDENASLVNMNVTTTSGSQVIRQTKRVMAYQPGKSLLILTTFTLNQPKTNLRQRCGYFDENNGIYFEVDEQTINLVLRSRTTGVIQETRIQRDNWNTDKLDGTGPSGISLNNFNHSLIMWIDIEWLGVGNVRVGFILNGEYVNCHTFRHTPDNNPIIGTYMTTACLPLRLEITNKGITSSNSTLKQICSSVVSEAGFEGIPKAFDISLGTTVRKMVDADTNYPIISIRMKSTRIKSIVVPSSISVVLTSNQIALYKVLLNPTLTGASWSTHSNGVVEYDTSATAVINGVSMISGYIDKGDSIEISNVKDFQYQLGSTISGISDIITLIMASNSGNVDVLASLAWHEYIT